MLYLEVEGSKFFNDLAKAKIS